MQISRRRPESSSAPRSFPSVSVPYELNRVAPADEILKVSACSRTSQSAKVLPIETTKSPFWLLPQAKAMSLTDGPSNRVAAALSSPLRQDPLRCEPRNDGAGFPMKSRCRVRSLKHSIPTATVRAYLEWYWLLELLNHHSEASSLYLSLFEENVVFGSVRLP